MSSSLRVVFMGTPEFAVPALNAILAAGHDVIAVYTRAPKPKGRGQAVQKSPIHDVADTHHIPVYTPASLRKSAEAVAEFVALAPDVAVVAAYGLVLPQDVLAAPKYGCINIHASLLPRWRGASPIHHAIWLGDGETGVTIMQMNQGLDTGDMIDMDRVAITSETTTPMLNDALAQMGGRLILKTLDQLAAHGAVPATPQPDQGVTIAPLLTKEDGRIDWQQPAPKIHAQMRALTPWPGTFTRHGDDQEFKILGATPAKAGVQIQSHGPRLSPGWQCGEVLDRDGHIACGGGTILQVTQIQVPSGKKMDLAAAINGGYIHIGDVFQ